MYAMNHADSILLLRLSVKMANPVVSPGTPRIAAQLAGTTDVGDFKEGGPDVIIDDWPIDQVITRLHRVGIRGCRPHRQSGCSTAGGVAGFSPGALRCESIRVRETRNAGRPVDPPQGRMTAAGSTA